VWALLLEVEVVEEVKVVKVSREKLSLVLIEVSLLALPFLAAQSFVDRL